MCVEMCVVSCKVCGSSSFNIEGPGSEIRTAAKKEKTTSSWMSDLCKPSASSSTPGRLELQDSQFFPEGNHETDVSVVAHVLGWMRDAGNWLEGSISKVETPALLTGLYKKCGPNGITPIRSCSIGLK